MEGWDEYNPENYLGIKVRFKKHTQGDFKVVAQAPNLAPGYIGSGRTKKEAFEEAKSTITKIRREDLLREEKMRG